MSQHDNSEPVESRAASWLVRFEHAEVSDEERAEFMRWLLEKPQHEEEFVAASRLLATLQDLPQEARQRLAEPQPAPTRQGWARWMPAPAIIATTLVLAALSWLAIYGQGSHSQTQLTQAGETRTVSFNDGSVAYLNTRTEIRWMSDRSVKLIAGEALFDVVHDDNRPFIVNLQGSEIRVLGTRFNVYTKASNDVVVTVLEGTVEVRGFKQGETQPEWVRRLHANEQMVYRSIGLVAEPQNVDALNAVLWREGILRIPEEGTQLPTLLDELSRYTDKPFLIRDPRLAEIHVGGQFSTQDVRTVLRYLQAVAPIDVHESESAYVLDYRTGETASDDIP